ncbi:MAG: hypothetical protein ACTSRZ_09595 [Promethearchaeota archaeon]
MSVRYFDNYAEIEVKCPICKQKVKVKVDYIHRKKAERFPFEFLYLHGDASSKHGLTLYLDKDMQVRGVEGVKNIKSEQEDIPEVKIFPIKKGKIPPMARSLGIISQKDYEILEKSDGSNSIWDISQKLNIPLIEISKIIYKLQDKGYLYLKKED